MKLCSEANITVQDIPKQLSATAPCGVTPQASRNDKRPQHTQTYCQRVGTCRNTHQHTLEHMHHKTYTKTHKITNIHHTAHKTYTIQHTQHITTHTPHTARTPFESVTLSLNVHTTAPYSSIPPLYIGSRKKSNACINPSTCCLYTHVLMV